MGRPAVVRLLLDPHIFPWSLLDVGRLGDHVVAALEEPTNELWRSPGKLLLADRGRVLLEPDPLAWLRTVYPTIPWREAPVAHEVAMESRLIDPPHQDPVDRFLAATARVYGLTLMTADERLLRSRPCAVLANR